MIHKYIVVMFDIFLFYLLLKWMISYYMLSRHKHCKYLYLFFNYYLENKRLIDKKYPSFKKHINDLYDNYLNKKHFNFYIPTSEIFKLVNSLINVFIKNHDSADSIYLQLKNNTILNDYLDIILYIYIDQSILNRFFYKYLFSIIIVFNLFLKYIFHVVYGRFFNNDAYKSLKINYLKEVMYIYVTLKIKKFA